MPTFYRHVRSHQDKLLKNQDNKATDDQPKSEVYCQHCCMFFESLSGFEQHVKGFSPGEIIHCPLCSKSVPSKEAYRKHKARFHKNAQAEPVTRPAVSEKLSASLDATLDNMHDMEVEQMPLEEPSLASGSGTLPVSPSDFGLSDKTPFEVQKKALVQDLLAGLVDIRTRHGIPEMAIDSIVDMFKNASEKSSEVMKQRFEVMLSDALPQLTKKEIQDMWLQLNGFNALDQIMQNGRLSTRAKRETTTRSQFSMVQQRKILVGQEPGLGMSYLSYSPPRELLNRYLSDESVFAQYLRTGQTSKKYHQEEIFKDFFTGTYYQDVLDTIPVSQSHLPPLLLGLYR